ncbi:cilia- and flagella-associated protein 90-like [Liolophura sinensis]|uniref:cilia- and flagella-associated protein 90-like n=1 Tax=Liolophura sinensis TaxID=3198878 RepID=UPI0031597824
MSEEVLKVKTDSDEFVLRGRPCELSAFSFVPTERKEPVERTYFNSPKKNHYPLCQYDRLFREVDGYNNKLHRDDREHAKSLGLSVNNEEKVKAIPSKSSSEYGHRLACAKDPPTREHVRIGYVEAEFFRRNGINIQENR